MEAILVQRSSIQLKGKPGEGKSVAIAREKNLVHPVVGAVITAALLALFTWAIEQMMRLTNTGPNGTLYLIPVAFGAALLGLRGGYVAAVVALALDWTVAATGRQPMEPVASVDSVTRYLTLCLSMFIIASVTGCLKSAFEDLKSLNASLLESEQRRLGFNREVLLAVTGGRLMLCDDTEIRALVSEASPLVSIALNEPRDVAELRHVLRHIVQDRQLDFCRLDDLEVAVTEAATNAIKHGRGGLAELRVTAQEISLLIVDNGDGISPADLARATLERGFSTSVSLGMGFTIMLETVDMLALSSSSRGTSVLLRSYNTRPPKLEDRLLARFQPLEVGSPHPQSLGRGSAAEPGA